MLSKLKANLAQAHNRTKKYADSKRSERHFEVGTMVRAAAMKPDLRCDWGGG
jgi:hypothetical protein